MIHLIRPKIKAYFSAQFSVEKCVYVPWDIKQIDEWSNYIRV